MSARTTLDHNCEPELQDTNEAQLSRCPALTRVSHSARGQCELCEIVVAVAALEDQLTTTSLGFGLPLWSLSLSCKRSWHFIIHARAPFKARGNVNSKSLNLFGQFSPHRAQRAEQNISRDRQKTCRKLFEKGREKCAHDAFQLGLGRIWSNNVRTLSLASAKLYLHRETCDYFFVFFFFRNPKALRVLRAVGQSGSIKCCNCCEHRWIDLWEARRAAHIYETWHEKLWRELIGIWSECIRKRERSRIFFHCIHLRIT